MSNVYLAIALGPLVGAIIAGLFGHYVGRAGAHWATILGVALSFVLSLWVVQGHHHRTVPRLSTARSIPGR